MALKLVYGRNSTNYFQALALGEELTAYRWEPTSYACSLKICQSVWSVVSSGSVWPPMSRFARAKNAMSVNLGGITADNV